MLLVCSWLSLSLPCSFEADLCLLLCRTRCKMTSANGVKQVSSWTEDDMCELEGIFTACGETDADMFFIPPLQHTILPTSGIKKHAGGRSDKIYLTTT